MRRVLTVPILQTLTEVLTLPQELLHQIIQEGCGDQDTCLNIALASSWTNNIAVKWLYTTVIVQSMSQLDRFLALMNSGSSRRHCDIMRHFAIDCLVRENVVDDRYEHVVICMLSKCPNLRSLYLDGHLDGTVMLTLPMDGVKPIADSSELHLTFRSDLKEEIFAIAEIGRTLTARVTHLYLCRLSWYEEPLVFGWFPRLGRLARSLLATEPRNVGMLTIPSTTHTAKLLLFPSSVTQIVLVVQIVRKTAPNALMLARWFKKLRRSDSRFYFAWDDSASGHFSMGSIDEWQAEIRGESIWKRAVLETAAYEKEWWP